MYDFENRLVRRGNVTIVYDGDGNRVSETVGGATVSYTVADVNPTGYPQVVQERQDQFGPILKNYQWGLQLIAEGDLSQSALHYYGMDGHGSVRYLTDATGTITDTYDYDAFGNLIAQTGTTANNYLFAGEQFDPALGVYYNRARYFDQRLGRFWTADTFEGDSQAPESLHKYLYSSANPVNQLDPSGNFSIGEAAITAGIVGFISGTALSLLQGKSIGQSLLQGVLFAGLGIGLTYLGAGVAIAYGVPLASGIFIANAPLTGFALATALNELNSTDRATVNRGQLSLALLSLALVPGGNVESVTELEVIASIRTKTAASTDRNIAYAFAELDGVQTQAISVSGTADIPGTVPPPVNRVFSTIDVNGFNRANDTEVKILEGYARQVTPSSTGKITIISERPGCDSCSGVAAQFQHAFPGIRVEIRQASSDRLLDIK